MITDAPAPSPSSASLIDLALTSCRSHLGRLAKRAARFRVRSRHSTDAHVRHTASSAHSPGQAAGATFILTTTIPHSPRLFLMSNPASTLRLACILFPQAQPLDFVGPMEVLSGLSPTSPFPSPGPLAHHLSVTYIAETLEPVTLVSGLRVLPDQTFDAADEERWDVLFVPGGYGACPPLSDGLDRAKRFLREHAEKAEYILTGRSCAFQALALRWLTLPVSGLTVVCTGSWLLASLGLLDGKRATSNKAIFVSRSPTVLTTVPRPRG